MCLLGTINITMPVCKMVSVDYLNRTGKQDALIGILFCFKFNIELARKLYWSYNENKYKRVK